MGTWSRTTQRFGMGLLALSLAGCPDPVDKAAKARIFSPEEPPRFLTQAAEKLSPETLAEDASRIRRVFQMSPAETGERLGPHKVSARVVWSWTRDDVDPPRKVDLDELHVIQLGQKGDFTARIDAGDQLGESKQGMEFWRVGGRVFARSRFQKFRERLRDRGAAERYRDHVHGVLSELYSLAEGRIALIPKGSGDVAGRRAVKFQVALAEKAPTLPTLGSPIPPPVPPRGAISPRTSRLAELDRRRVPSRVDGTLAVDAETGVVLEADLKLDLAVEGLEESKARLALTCSWAIEGIGKELATTPPEGALPDEGRPLSVAAALERFDLPRAALQTDGGSPTKPNTGGPPEPDDE